MKSIGLSPALVRVFAQGFDGGDSMTLRLCRKQRPGIDGFTVEQNRIGSGETLFVSELYAVKTKPAQSSEQGGGCGRVDSVFDSVDLEDDVHCGSL